MAGLGNDLVVNLAGNNSKLKSTIAESKGGLKSFGASAASFLNPVTAGLTAVAGAAVAAGIAIYGLTANIDKLDKVAKDAARTGVSGKFLQQLTFAADQSGIGIEQLTVGIKKLTIAVGKGDDKPFAALGLSLAELKTLKPEQQFLKVADAIGKLPTAAQRAAASVAIFGKSGIEMTTLFGGGMDGIVKLMERAEELHIGVSAEGLAKVEAANDALGQMKASFGALIDQVTVGLAPVFTLVATAIADMIPPITKFVDKFNGIEEKAKFLGDLLDAGMSVAFESIRANWDVMLGEMIIAAKNAGLQIAQNLNPVNTIGGAIGKTIGGAIGGGNDVPGKTPLQVAQDKLANVLAQMGPDDQGLIRGKLPTMGGKPEKAFDDGSKIKSLAGDLAESASGLFNKASLAATSKFTDLKIKGGYLGSVVENMFTGDKKKASKETGPNKIETKFAGAMQKGSAEAFSTVLAAMMSSSRDPNVIATQKQTVAIVKAVKENKPPKFAMVEGFAGAFM